MADIVQMRLEQMLPEIEDLEKKKIFNKVINYKFIFDWKRTKKYKSTFK